MGLNNTIFTNESPGLFNGNIAAMMTDIKILATEENPNVSIYGYSYDQLHRIKNATNYRAVGMGYEGSNMYNTTYSYDPDGNLTNLQRGGQEENNVMDRLSYVYGASSRPNQLTQVNDLASDGTPGQFSGTEGYLYDQIGNLTETTSNGNLTKIDWDVYNKVKQVTNEDLLTRYLYDGAGNRVLTFKNVGFEERRQQITAYSRDASGNTLAVYDASDGESYPYGHPLEEMYVFGSSRIGVDKTLRTDDRNPGIFIYHKDLTTTHYEISNHLGNVLTTVTGRKLGQVQNDVLDHYLPEVVTATDYYAFGAQMPGRSYENTTLSGTNGYRYAFNGKEHDSDGEFGSLTHYDYGFRIYNPSIGKFLSIDPLASKMPEWSPYTYTFNNPIRYIDPDGRMPQQGGPGDPPSIFSGIQQKWQDLKNNLFGSGDDQPTNGEIYHETIELGKRLEKVVDIQTALIPGLSLIDPRTSGKQKAADGMVEMAAIFIPGIKFVKKVDGVAVKYADEIVEFIQGKGDDAVKVAAQLPEGFKKVKETIKGQKIFSDGKTYISPDVDGHNGGVWKAAKSIEKLGTKDTRLGTYDAEFKRIGD